MFYFNLGIRHITDLEAYDHMLFLLALTLPLSFGQWKATLKWITAFTLGHSLSLALAATEMIRIPSNWVELGIAITISMTVGYHLINGFKVVQGAMWLSGIFGLIHGLGFGSYYSFITHSDSFWWAWIPFNLGIGQTKFSWFWPCFLYIGQSKKFGAIPKPRNGCSAE